MFELEGFRAFMTRKKDRTTPRRNQGNLVDTGEETRSETSLSEDSLGQVAPPVPIEEPLVGETGNGLTREEAVIAEPPVAEPARVPAKIVVPLSVETILWLALSLAAAGLRLMDLGRWPLSEAEAGLALAASFQGAGQESPLTGLSPLLLHATSLLLWLFMPTDGWVRAIPALAGIGTILGFLLLRPVLGRGVALGAALMATLSPALLFFSRQAQPEALTLFFSVLLLAGVGRFVLTRRAREAWLATVALAFGLASGPGFWSLLLAGALVLAWRGYKESRTEEERQAVPVAEGLDSLGEENQTIAGLRGFWDDLRPLAPRLVIGGLVLFAAATTALGTRPTGLALAFDLPAQWIGALAGRGTMMNFPLMLALVLYELPIVILGIAGAAIWIDRQPGWVGFLLLWIAVNLVPATLLNSDWAGGVALVALPLTILSGAALARIGSAIQREAHWEIEGAYAALTAVLGGFAWLNILAYLQTAESLHLVLAVVALLILGAGLFMVWSLGENRSIWRALGLVAALLLPLIAFRTSWMLSYMHGNDPREPLVAAQVPSDPDLRTLASFLTNLSNERLRQRDTLPIALQRSLGAAPQWYLRNFTQLRLIEGSAAVLDETTAAILSPDQPAPPGTIGSRYVIRPTWQWPNLSGQPLMRWIVLREVNAGLGAQEAILYVRVPQ